MVVGRTRMGVSCRWGVLVMVAIVGGELGGSGGVGLVRGRM